MANNHQPTADASFPSASPSDIFGHTSIRRRLTIIPSDQRKLLNRDESWATSLRRRPNGAVNVPPDVLDNLRESYIRQLQPTQSDKSLASADASQNGSIQGEPGDGQSSIGFQSQCGDENGHEDEAESGQEDGNGDNDGSGHIVKQTTPTSWYESLERNFTPRSEIGDVEIDEPFATQISETSPPQPTVQPPSRRSTFNDFSSSSLEQEDELEIEVPTALGHDALANNKPAQQTFATPPSAQVVPCTFELSEHSPKPKTRKNAKQPIYKPPPPLYRPPKIAATSMNSVAKPSIASVGPAEPLFVNAQSSNSTSNESSSIIPSTHPDEGIHKSLSTWIDQSVPSPTLEPQTGPDIVARRGSPPVQQHTAETMPRSPQPMIVPPLPSAVQPISPPRAQPTINPEAPFIRYTIAYPNYNGNIGDFVTSCMYIQLQQRRLRTSLYDDFIRAWFEGYIPYVRDCDDSEPPVKAMNAIEWFNSIDDDPLFTSRVVTRQNLAATLNFYPEELRAAQNLLGVAPNPSRESSQILDRVQPKHSPAAELEPIAAPTETRAKETPTSAPVVPSHAPSADGTIAPAQLPVRTSPQKEPNRTMPLPKPMNQPERRPIQSKGLSRSFSEVVPNKRKASNDLAMDVPKRISTSFMMRSDSGSTASFHSENSKETVPPSGTPTSTLERKKKYANDPEKRSKQFAKFLKRRKWEKESIASSAPISNTPTSGQKH